MKNKIILQAHRGVTSEYPENTMTAFKAAAAQGYGIIELDPSYTSDDRFVTLHDYTLNRTARKADGSLIEETIDIRNITYARACEYDYGIGFALRFKGEKLPLMKDVLDFAEKNDIILKIDNKIQSFPENILEKFLTHMHETDAALAFTCKTIDFARRIANEFPLAHVHYDGEVSEAVLKELVSFVSPEILVVWIAYPNKSTEWVTVPRASRKLCSLIKKYARLGIWIISDFADYEKAVIDFGADIIETTGTIKPEKNQGLVADMHTHSKSSHDSTCEIEDMIYSQVSRGTAVFAVTDHCDLEHADVIDVEAVVRSSFEDSTYHAEKFAGQIELLRGVELGKGYVLTELQDKIAGLFPYDVIIGSVHTFDFEGEKAPYSKIDFSKMSAEVIDRYLKQYFSIVYEMLCTMPCDIMAHLTCPLRYINGKYGRGVDSRAYEEDITRILEYIIVHGIALEINTSGMGGANDSPMPDKWIIEKFKSMGGYLITLGSDAHIAANASNGFEQIIDYLRNIGFENIYYYKNRINIQCKL